MKVDHASTSWTIEVRAQAVTAVTLAASKHRDTGRTLAYFLRCALAHGVALDDVARAAGLTPTEVQRLTDPAVA